VSRLVHSARLVYRAYRYRWKLDPAEIAFLRAHTGRGTTAIDIGAHKGGYTYWLAQGVGPRGRVIAFEPQPLLAGRLRDSLPWTGRVAVENMGISDHCGALRLFVPGGKPSPGASFEKTDASPESGEQIEVPVSTLDTYLERHPGPGISIIKCDVEGHELRVFRGAEQTLRQAGPVLLFECEQRHHGDRDMRDVFAYLEGLGYQGYFFERAQLRLVAEFDPAKHQDRQAPALYCNNFAFLRKTPGKKPA
jgi:FkbM family methyltransferase